jgi:hypothetical protein
MRGRYCLCRDLSSAEADAASLQDVADTLIPKQSPGGQVHSHLIDDVRVEVGSDLPGPPDSSRSATESAPTCSFELIGNVWHVQFASETTEIADTLAGLKFIARLLQQKHVAIPALQLEGHQETRIPRIQSDGPVLTKEAKAAYQHRLHEIDQAMMEVAKWQDQTEHNKLAAEKETILAELKAAVGQGGKDRLLSAGNESLKAADRVRKAIATVCARLGTDQYSMPKFAEHLQRDIKKEGNGFAYRPCPPEPVWRISF